MFKHLIIYVDDSEGVHTGYLENIYNITLSLIKNVKNNVVFLTRNLFNSYNFSVVSYKQEMSLLQLKVNSLKKHLTKTWKCMIR